MVWAPERTKPLPDAAGGRGRWGGTLWLSLPPTSRLPSGPPTGRSHQDTGEPGACKTQSLPCRSVLGRRIPGTIAATRTPEEPRPCCEEARSPPGRRTAPSHVSMAVSPCPPLPACGSASHTSGRARAGRHPYFGLPWRAGSIHTCRAGLFIVPGLAWPRPPHSHPPAFWTSPSLRSPACSVTSYLPQRTHRYHILCWEFTHIREPSPCKNTGQQRVRPPIRLQTEAQRVKRSV